MAVGMETVQEQAAERAIVGWGRVVAGGGIGRRLGLSVSSPRWFAVFAAV